MKIDEKWGGDLKRVGNFGPGFFKIQKESETEQKKLFLKDEVRNPAFTYPELNRANLNERFTAAKLLKSQIIKHESNEYIQEVYLRKIEESINSIKIIKACQRKDDTDFLSNSKKIYGEPEVDIFHYIIQKAKESYNSNNDGQKEAYKVLREKIGIDKETHSTVPLFQKKPPPTQKGELLGSEEIKTQVIKALKRRDLNSWNAEIHPSHGMIVNHTKKTLLIPEERKLYQHEIEGLIAHEIDVHIARKENGSKSELHILSQGFDKYLVGEEGLAAHNQSHYFGNTEYFGTMRYLAISLACGLSGKEMDFRDVFEILYSICILRGLTHNKAQEKSWVSCTRTFRGTTCKTPGTCYTKDLAYTKGHIEIAKIAKSEEMKRSMVGKYDPTNERHRWILDGLNIHH